MKVLKTTNINKISNKTIKNSSHYEKTMYVLCIKLLVCLYLFANC